MNSRPPPSGPRRRKRKRWRRRRQRKRRPCPHTKIKQHDDDIDAFLICFPLSYKSFSPFLLTTIVIIVSSCIQLGECVPHTHTLFLALSLQFEDRLWHPVIIVNFDIILTWSCHLLLLLWTSCKKTHAQTHLHLEGERITVYKTKYSTYILEKL